ncbi:MAG: hypothetical protein HFG57_11380, partial [Lachnospiraceae bacterium]|nr:hypothetical protein [Lachnospiraceae bacterium]
LIPDLTLPTEPELPLGRYALMHRDYLENHKRVTCEKRYYYFEQIPEICNTYSEKNPDTVVMKEQLDAYRIRDRNKADSSRTYEKYTKLHPHYPGRMDHTMRHEEEKAAVPPEYQIDLD